MRHRSEPDDYRWSHVQIQIHDTRDFHWKLMVEGKGHVMTTDHGLYGKGLQVFLWDGTDERDDDGDLEGTYLRLHGVTYSAFWRETAYWDGWLEGGDKALELLKAADLELGRWSFARVTAFWAKETTE